MRAYLRAACAPSSLHPFIHSSILGRETLVRLQTFLPNSPAWHGTARHGTARLGTAALETAVQVRAGGARRVPVRH